MNADVVTRILSTAGAPATPGGAICHHGFVTGERASSIAIFIALFSGPPSRARYVYRKFWKMFEDIRWMALVYLPPV